jgi:hypothetical protein
MFDNLKQIIRSLFNSAQAPVENESASLVPGQKLPPGVHWRINKSDYIADCNTCHAHVVFPNAVNRERRKTIFTHCHGKKHDTVPRSVRPVARARARTLVVPAF